MYIQKIIETLILQENTLISHYKRYEDDINMLFSTNYHKGKQDGLKLALEVVLAVEAPWGDAKEQLIKGYELLYQCYLSGQISDDKWILHLQDTDLVEYIHKKFKKIKKSYKGD